jgi:uncharacterized surface protein with fasciclin (FAS1) repeats
VHFGVSAITAISALENSDTGATAALTIADVYQSNGVIHVIDSVVTAR